MACYGVKYFSQSIIGRCTVTSDVTVLCGILENKCCGFNTLRVLFTDSVLHGTLVSSYVCDGTLIRLKHHCRNK